MPFTVTRQNYYYSGKQVVEVSEGDLDNSGPDMLVPQFRALGEGETFTDPRAAVEAAINVCKAWRTASKSRKPCVAAGFTVGGSLELEGNTFRGVRAYAKKKWSILAKCDECGEPLPDKRDRYHLDDHDGEYCSDRCAEYAGEAIQKQEMVDGYRCTECGYYHGNTAFQYADESERYCSLTCIAAAHVCDEDDAAIKEVSL